MLIEHSRYRVTMHRDKMTLIEGCVFFSCVAASMPFNNGIDTSK